MVTSNLLLESIFSKLLCDTDSCLSYIIIFLDILSVFYLVFCSYYKITKTVRLLGYIWSALLLCGTVTIMVLHTCIFTIIGAIFTIMIEMAMLSVVFKHNESTEENPKKPAETKKKNVGCYVIFPTNDDKFVFGLHGKRNKLLAMSTYKYSTVEEAKEAINSAKVCGEDCEFEDLTKNWVIDAKHPKFQMYLEQQKYFFELAVNENLTVLKSVAIDDAALCLKMVKEAKKCLTSDILYFATSKEDIENGKNYRLYPTDDEKPEVVEDEKQEAEDDNTEAEAKTLAESLKEIENIKSSNNVNKQTLYDYFNKKYHKKVILNRRENQTITGLPLADTYYTFHESINEKGKTVKKQICFAYIYENEGACLILAKLDDSFAKALKKSKKSITRSKFPKTKQNNWFSVIVDDTYTEDDIHEVLEHAKEYCEK